DRAVPRPHGEGSGPGSAVAVAAAVDRVRHHAVRLANAVGPDSGPGRATKRNRLVHTEIGPAAAAAPVAAAAPRDAAAVGAALWPASLSDAGWMGEQCHTRGVQEIQ